MPARGISWVNEPFSGSPGAETPPIRGLYPLLPCGGWFCYIGQIAHVLPEYGRIARRRLDKAGVQEENTGNCVFSGYITE